MLRFGRRSIREGLADIHRILQAVRDQPFEEGSLLAQNPLSGQNCIHLTLSDDGLNQTKQLSVSLHQQALEGQLTFLNLSAPVPADVDAWVT